tara:strand:- start:1 stop:150 length:150 start_codon:yes stop_codon:yes gene_type:complete
MIPVSAMQQLMNWSIFPAALSFWATGLSAKSTLTRTLVRQALKTGELSW